MRKWNIVLVLIIVLCCMGLGIYARTQYTDVLSECITNEKWEGIKVNYVLNDADDEKIENIFLREKKCLNSAEYIAKIKVVEKPVNYLVSTKWKVEILEVYKGNEEIESGQVIDYYATHACLLAKDKAWIGSFTNLMKEEKEYVLYFNKGLIVDNTTLNYVSPEDTYIRYFCTTDLENVTNEKEYKKYKEKYAMTTVWENEFFGENEQVIEGFQKFKVEMLREWGL